MGRIGWLAHQTWLGPAERSGRASSTGRARDNDASSAVQAVSQNMMGLLHQASTARCPEQHALRKSVGLWPDTVPATDTGRAFCPTRAEHTALPWQCSACSRTPRHTTHPASSSHRERKKSRTRLAVGGADLVLRARQANAPAGDGDVADAGEATTIRLGSQPSTYRPSTYRPCERRPANVDQQTSTQSRPHPTRLGGWP